MGKYYSYAQRLDTAYKDALDQFAKSWKKFMDAQEKLDEAQKWRFGETSAERELNTAKARIALTEAQVAFESERTSVWDDFNRQRAQIKKELEEAVRADGTANPDAVDNNALELMKSGIMTASDYSSMAERFSGNATMTRLISRYARDAALSVDNMREKAALNAIAVTCADGLNSTMRAWDSLSKIADHCSGQSRKGINARPEHVLAMGTHWEELSAEAIQNF